MNKFIADTTKLIGLPGTSYREGVNHDVYVLVPEDRFQEALKGLSRELDLMAVFCAESFAGRKGFTLFYVFEKSACHEALVLERQLEGNRATSVARWYPSACWYEREISDGFGIDFVDAFDRRRLFLHEMYPADFHPLLKSYRNQPLETGKVIPLEEEYRFNRFDGEGVYQIPVGPVHAGIIEPGHFRFSVIGETIFNLEIRMFYKHRGVEKLAEGKAPAQCLSIAESISGDESAANAAAFCIAVEHISGIHVSERAWQLRTVLLEMERIYSHLGDMAGMITDVAYPVGASGFYILREEILRQNAVLTGSRFLKGAFGIGGLKRDLSAEAVRGLSEYLGGFPERLKDVLDLVLKSSWVVDRLETTGVIKKDLVRPLHLTGPAARASGVEGDTRLDHPYGFYTQMAPKRHLQEKGDVMSRFEVKSAEVLDSVDMVRRLLDSLDPGEVASPARISDGHALAAVEAPRGQTVVWVSIRNGVIDRYKVRTASFCNWRAIEHAVMGNIVPDFPLINKSLNLSYAGTDL